MINKWAEYNIVIGENSNFRILSILKKVYMILNISCYWIGN